MDPCFCVLDHRNKPRMRLSGTCGTQIEGQTLKVLVISQIKPIFTLFQSLLQQRLLEHYQSSC